uniref:Pyrroline-5-carboxylate reductase 3 n=1 Tax=Ursus maritimus TaxID=29073 RepID=A0A452SYR7_URSMA
MDGLGESWLLGVGLVQAFAMGETHEDPWGCRVASNRKGYGLGGCPTYPAPIPLSPLQALGCRTTHSNQEVLQNCFLVFFATKPHVLPAVLAEVAPVVTAEHILVSVAAGVSLSTLEELLPPTARVLRVSPNLPCMVQEGAMVMARGRHAGSSEATLLQTLLEACGQCEEVPEAHVDIHTGLSGSGVAFVCAFSEALAEGAIKMGMPGGLAHRIAAQTLLDCSSPTMQEPPDLHTRK